ncbi:MAG: hypothetical protein EKK55_10220 [Rhodocyclaceae bacterium]|nr:MAG: hypothetical protein EKK55_10220 [Rhodocyclaceae bacterium]
MPAISFEFQARGAAAVRQQVAAVQNAARRASADATRVAVAEANNRTRVTLAMIAREARARSEATNNAAKAERQRTAIAAAHGAARERLTQREAEAKARAYAAATRSAENAERAQTRVVEREARRRDRIAEQSARARSRTNERNSNAGAQAGQRAFAYAEGFARDAHGQIQGARRSRAETEHTLNSALYQAGVSGTEAAGMRARVFREVESGRLQGLSADEVAQALAATQTQFSSLTRGAEGLTGEAAVARRQQNLNDMLGAAEFARNTYQGPAEVMRVAGMLSSQGVTGDNQRAALEAMTGIAQAGSIELANVTREALGPLMQSIAFATGRLGSGATAEQRAAAVRDATISTLAVGEVGAGAGLSSRDSLNAYAKIQRNMQSDVVTGHLFEALSARRGGRAVASELFTTERDSRGQTVHRMRAGQDALGVMGRLQTFAGGSTQLANLLQGGGGEAMILDAQVRRFLGGLSSQTAGGQSMSQRVQELIAQGRSFGQADVNRGAAMVNAEQRTEIVAQEERRNAALTMDSAALRFSNAVDRFAHDNPFAASLAGGAVSAGGGMLSGSIGSMVGGAAQASGAFRGLSTAAGALGRGLGALGAVAGAAAVGIEAGHWIGNRLDEATRATQTSDGTRITYGANQDGPSLWDASTWRELGAGIADAFRSNPPVVQISPQAAAQAAGVARTEAAARQNRT